jgi:hypothetical protein
MSNLSWYDNYQPAMGSAYLPGQDPGTVSITMAIDFVHVPGAPPQTFVTQTVSAQITADTDVEVPVLFQCQGP